MVWCSVIILRWHWVSIKQWRLTKGCYDDDDDDDDDDADADDKAIGIVIVSGIC